MRQSSTTEQFADDEFDARSELAAAEAEYVEAANDAAEVESRFQDVWAEKNHATQALKEAAARYRAAFRSAHGCNLPDLTGEIVASYASSQRVRQ